MSSAETETESAVEPTVDTAAESPAPVRRRPAAKRPAKLDALLAAAVDRARQGVLEMAPAEQVGDHVGVVAEAERLVVHRFESKLPGYIGWQWFASLARAPRSKEITVCEIGLLPSEKSLLAPDWVPWAERVRPEEAAAEAESIADENNDGENNDGAGQAPDEAANDVDGSAEAGPVDEAAAPAVDESAGRASADPDPSTSDSATSENAGSADAVLEPSSSEHSADELVTDELASDVKTAEANAEAVESAPETIDSGFEAPETTPHPEATA
jgi:hypothetical protein